MMVRGIKQQMDLWEMFMQTQMFHWKRNKLLKDKKGNYRKNKDGTFKRGPDELTRVQGALRPIQLYEYVFPEECLKEVIPMLNMHDITSVRPEVNNFAWILRKMMKLKKLPDYPEMKGKPQTDLTGRYIPCHNGVAVYPIGIKLDGKADFPNYGYYQEGL